MNELNLIRTRLNELKKEKTKANSERIALIKILRDSGVEIDANLSWDAIHDKMRMLKRKAHHLRNRSKDLKFNPRIEGEIPLDDEY